MEVVHVQQVEVCNMIRCLWVECDAEMIIQSTWMCYKLLVGRPGWLEPL